MGIFNRAIPNVQTNNLNQVRISPIEEPYVDDIFDPLFNASVRAHLTKKYGSPFLGTIGGYMEGIDNALIGQNEQWGVLGPGMGILSGFGRSMDKAGDAIIGSLTEGVKYATGQGFENPLRNIFVEDEDYTGTRLLAAMGNSMAGLAQAPKLNESDFKGMWNVPAMSAELMTDPGILGTGMMKAGTAINLRKQVAGQTANSTLADIGSLLNDYDNFMAKVSLDLTAPGLRGGAKALLNQIQQMLGHSSAKSYANTAFNSKETPESRAQATELLQNDTQTQTLLEMADEVSSVDEAITQANLTKSVNLSGEGTLPVEDLDTLDELFESRDIEMIRRALHISTPEYLDVIRTANQKDDDVIAALHSILGSEDRTIAEWESQMFNDLTQRPEINSDLSVVRLPETYDPRVELENYLKLRDTVRQVRTLDLPDLKALGINPEYATLNDFPDLLSGNISEDLLNESPERLLEALSEQLSGSPLADELAKGTFYNVSEFPPTQNAVLRLAGVSPVPRRDWALDTPVTLSPSAFAGRTEESYRKGVQAIYTVLNNAFTKAGFPLENFKSATDIDNLFDTSVFKKSFPDEKVRTEITSGLKSLLFAEGTSASTYVRDTDKLTQKIIDSVRTVHDDAATLVERVEEYALATGKSPAEVLNSLKEQYTLMPWVQSQTGTLREGARVNFLEDLKKLDETFNLEKSQKSQKALKRMYSVGKYRDDVVRHITSNNPLPPVTDARYLTAKQAQDLSIQQHLKENLTPYDRGLLTKLDRLGIADLESIPRALATSEQYHTFWNNILKRYEAGAKGTPYVITQELAEASERIRTDVLDRLSRKGEVFNTSYNNFFRVNARLFDDFEFFNMFMDDTLPELAKHYEVKLKPEYFSKTDMSLNEAVKNGQSYATRTLAKRASDILEEFYTLFDDDIAFLLKHNIDPRTPISKFKRYKNNAQVYDTLERVQTNLGKTPPAPTLTKEVPKNYKAYNYILNHIFPIGYVPVKGSTRNVPRIIDHYAYSAYDKPFTLHLTELPLKEVSFSEGIGLLNANMAADYLPPVHVHSSRSKLKSELYAVTVPSRSRAKKVYRNAYPDRVMDTVIANLAEAPAKEAAEVIDNFPSHVEVVESELMREMGIPEDLARETPPSGSRIPPDAPKPSGEILNPPPFKDLRDLIHGAMVATSKASAGDKATLRTKYVQSILEDADLLMSKKGITTDDIAKYKRAQIYLSGASIPKEEFVDTLASSGMVLTAFKAGTPTDSVLKAFIKNVTEINVAMKSNVLKTVQFKLPNGNTVIGAMWDTENKNILNVFKKNYKNLKSAKLVDIVRLPKGDLSESVSEYIASPKYSELDKFFDRIRQQEGEYAKLLGFRYDDTRHVKNVRNMSPDTANYLANIVYKDLPVSAVDEISDKMVMELDSFKHLRGAWGTRKYDKRFLGQIEDFEDVDIRIFEDDASKIVRGSLGEGSFNNANFQLYVDLFDNDNFKIKNYAKTPEDLEAIFSAKLADGSESGNRQNLVLAAPRYSADGRVVGFTQFDKTTELGRRAALRNPDTVLLPAHVFSPLDKVLRKDAKMSNKVYSFITRHVTNPFKLGVLMNPGFLIGNANDAFLKQATAMAHKYGTSVPEEMSNVVAAVRDVYVLNNKFDDAYRRFLVHIQAEGFAIAPSNQISSLAATDPRIRKMLKNYVNGKLQKGAGQPLIECALSQDERNTVKLWLMLNSTQTAASFDKGLQDLDILAKSKNASEYQISKDPVSRVLEGKGEYVSNDVSTWGLLSNPLTRKIMDMSELTENTARAATILNDLRHRGMDAEWFSEYFDTLEALKEAAKTNPKTAEFRESIKKQFSFDMSEGLNTMHNANFDYERMTDFTDTVGKYVPFPTFFLKNLAFWLEVLVNHPQYIDHAITVQESLWGSRDTSEDKFAAEAKGRGAIPVSVGGQNLSNFFKGIFKPTPLQSMFGAFSLLNNPVEDVFYRLHPAISTTLTGLTQQGPLQPIAADLIPSEDVKYRPYSTDMYERNVTRDDPNFNTAEYAIHRFNPMERSIQSAIRLPDKLNEGDVQLSDFLPSVFQPDFGEKYTQ